MASKTELIEAVANICGVSKAEAGRAVDAVFTTITTNLSKGEDVRLSGFGSFSVSDHAARNGRNPQTGATIQIPAGKRAKFRASDALKSAVNGKSRAA